MRYCYSSWKKKDESFHMLICESEESMRNHYERESCLEQ